MPERPAGVRDTPTAPDAPGDNGGSGDGGYRRSAGSARGEARRRDLLERVTDDIAARGLADFSLRRAARAADTTHKVLLYHFESPEDLLAQAMAELRARRITAALQATPTRRTLASSVRALWPVLVGEDGWVHSQAIGLSMYDPQRYGDLGRGSSEQYLPTLLGICPDHWTPKHKTEVAQMIMATLRGFVVARALNPSPGASKDIEAGFRALTRALDREEASD